mmetsp:Transcript_7385/g.16180  ORF Transcript_7385/g.16180 Transcript_7385/m.16180 type:complete len:814 (+) Transcript_7385:81-2522(+)|eukprot:CAMPEP_0178414474 /NCGR_PEP_ID=MMETSP0689_2-20121128/23054_1 /TAXON_ID=160604 /ORGANISM="Amphidinium massartii, Strain CS-259" /LENGTH=813 /DNA_ID=CAMNT_0020035763 /DNA_START=31 /DNA_END=2472 /DNA_ORIENTATION=-
MTEEQIRWRFQQGLGRQKQPRPHQIACVKKQLRGLEGGQSRRFLHQHAAGSGKTEIIAVIALEVLRRGMFDSVIILNYATELEDQMFRRLDEFWDKAAASYLIRRRARTSRDIQQPLQKHEVFFSLLQKFQDVEGLRPQPGEKPLIIIDEAHRGVPDDGVFIKSIMRRYGEAAVQIYFTATPKVETFLSHGVLKEDGRYRVAFDVHTQADAVAERYVLNPLEKYRNVTSQLSVFGSSLLQIHGNVQMTTFVEKLHQQHSKEITNQYATFIMKHLADVHADMPRMVEQGHQIKHLVVAQSQQAVYDIGEQLKLLARKKAAKASNGGPPVIAVFFSGMVKTAGGKHIRDKEANGGKTDDKMLEEADIIVCCLKFLAGWDEWRVCSIFLCKRVLSEEFLQQMLARATRARPGTGKKRPLVFDLGNHPDDVCAAVARFWWETRHYQGPLGEVQEWEKRLRDFGVKDATPAQELVGSLSASDQILLRAAVIRYYRASAHYDASELPLSFNKLSQLLVELNLALKEQLFGGDETIAKSEAEQTAALKGRLASETSGPTSAGGTSVVKKTVPAALRHMRTALKLGRMKRPRTDVTATPAKRRLVVQQDAEAFLVESAGDPAGSLQEPSTPQTAPSSSLMPLGSNPSPPKNTDRVQLKDGLDQTVKEVADRYWNQLPEEGDGDTPDTREVELRSFKFASYPLRRFGEREVIAAEKSLRIKLSNNLGAVMKKFWERQREELEGNFQQKVEELQRSHAEDLAQQLQAEAESAVQELSELVDEVGGQVAGWQKRNLKKNLKAMIPSTVAPPFWSASQVSSLSLS